MEWEIIKISNTKSKDDTYATIGFGRIRMSCASCKLIDNLNEYQYAILMKARDNKKLRVGIKLLKQKEDNAIKISKRKSNGEIVENSMTIDNKTAIQEIFGIQGTQNKGTKYPVELSKEDPALLIINVE